jgi:NAD(P)-dependent dehydrogenase (short-subunit alcohol dehydrogenase family)
VARTALITGSSSGFGLLTAVTLARRGWRVLATMRDLSRRALLEDAARTAGVLDRPGCLDCIEIHALDVTKPAQIDAIAALIESSNAPLHALINNAGFVVPGFAEDVSDAELRDQFETNFFGAAALTRALLPRMRAQGFGHIVMLSSISGRTAFPGVSSYAAAKFALEGWSETLRFELKAAGIRVVLVEPGSFETDIWTRNAKVSARMQDPHAPNAQRVTRWREEFVRNNKRADPQVVADLIAAIVENPRPKLRYVIGRDAHRALLARRFLPWSLFERAVIKLSGMDK